MHRHAVLVLAAFVAAAPAGQALAQGCQRVELPAGFTVGDIKGVAPADGVICYDLVVPQGQNLSVEVVSGRNIITSGPGWEARSDRMFVGDLPGRMKLGVGQLMRAAEPEPFAVRVRFEAPGNG